MSWTCEYSFYINELKLNFTKFSRHFNISQFKKCGIKWAHTPVFIIYVCFFKPAAWQIYKETFL